MPKAKGKKGKKDAEEEVPDFGEVQPEDPSLPLMLALEQLLDNCRVVLMTRAQEYYAAKGQRTITRPAKIGASLDAMAETFAAFFGTLHQQGVQHREGAIKELRDQVEYTSAAVLRSQDAILDRILSIKRKEAVRATKVRQAELARELVELEEERRVNESQMKGGMQDLAHGRQLDALIAKERARAARAKDAIEQAGEDQRQIEARTARDAFQDVVLTTELMLATLSSMVQFDDIIKDDSVVVKNLSLKRLVKTAKRMESGAAEKETRTWPGLPLSELTPEVAREAAAEEAKRGSLGGLGLALHAAADDDEDAEEARDREAAASDKKKRTSTIVAKRTPLNRAILRGRNKHYQALTETFRSAVLQCDSKEREQLARESGWNRIWEATVVAFKELA